MFIQIPAYAAPGDVVINEIMYNPASGNNSDEFLELYNNTANDIDLTGWCFTSGITLCFDGTIIAANGFVLISQDGNQTLSHYGVSTEATYTGNLSNGGETITLTDNESNIADTVTYSDSSPWPASADGGGRSLELIDPLSDNDVSTSWGASNVVEGTPKAVNTLSTIDLPSVSNVVDPNDIEENESVVITATVTNASSVDLKYVENFENETTVSMTDDGTGADETSGDNIYSAEIPGFSSGTLARFKVEATNDDGTSSSPGVDDSINYFGYVVNNSTRNGAAPILQWFINDDNYDGLIGTPDGEQTYFDAVIAYGNEVFDASEIRLKGNYSRTFDKKPFKVKLPKGFYLDIPELFKYPVKEFHLNSDYPNGNQYIASLLSWKIFEYAGFDTPNYQKIQLNKNGSFYGAYLLADKYDDEWQENNPKYDGDYYDAYWEKTPEDNDFTKIDNWQENSFNLTGDALKTYARDNNDIANQINYMAAAAVARHHDWSVKQNLITYQDDETGRWSVLPWDLDLTFGNIPYNIENASYPGYGPMIDPLDMVDYLSPQDRAFGKAIWEDPELKEMYQRRVRNLMDELYGSGLIKQWANEFSTELYNVISEDFAIWGTDPNEIANIEAIRDLVRNTYGMDPDDPEVAAAFFAQMYPGVDISLFPDPITSIAPLTIANRLYLKFDLGVDNFVETYQDYFTSLDLLPEAEPEDAVVEISEIMYNPVGGNNDEYIELYNPNDYAVDLSGWEIDGIGLTLPGGSVIGSNSYALVVKDDVTHRNTYGGGHIIYASYNDNLANEGETISLIRDDESLSDSVAYSTSSPWPTQANGDGRSLVYAQDEECWAPSADNGGTPGEENNVDQDWLTTHEDDCIAQFPVEEPEDPEEPENTTTTTAPPTTTPGNTTSTTKPKANLSQTEETQTFETTPTPTPEDTTTTTYPALESSDNNSNEEAKVADQIVDANGNGMSPVWFIAGAALSLSLMCGGIFAFRRIYN